MDTATSAKDVLDTMLGYLGFVVDIREENPQEAPGSEPCLQVYTEEPDLLVGRKGDRLDDIQYLLNRVLQARDPDAPRVRVDVAHFRAMKEDNLIEEVKTIADRVRATGRPEKLRPMNAYYRRIVHNTFLEDPEITTWSPRDRTRIKQITLKRKPRRGD
jgi:spoIIIJ-associated protein